MGLSSPVLQLGPSDLNVTSRLIVVVTVAAARDTDALISMLLDLRRKSGKVPVIVFDNGLSAENKSEIETQIIECEIRPCSKNQTRGWSGESARTSLPSKAEMIDTVARDRYCRGIIVWADVGHLPDWDLRIILDRYPVGTSFVGDISQYRNSYVNLVDQAPSRFFIIFLDLRFQSKVLLPWKNCVSGAFCSILPRKSKLAVAAADSSETHLLWKALTTYKKSYRRSVLSYKNIGPGGGTKQVDHMHELLRILPAGLQPRIPFIACVTLFGPNNQLMMVLHLASLAQKLGVRFLAPPLRPHYLKTKRPEVSQSSTQIPANEIFSLHFLYQSAVIADSSSSWINLLPDVDFIIYNPPGCFRAVQNGCVSRKKCTVKQILKSRCVSSFFESVGINKNISGKIEIVDCESGAEACIKNSVINRRRIPIILWHNIGYIHSESVHSKSVKRKYPLLFSGHFQIPKASLERSIQHQQPCLSIHIRLKDAIMKQNSISVGSIQESKLLGSKCSQVLIRNQWGEWTVSDIINMARETASRRNLALYVLMPYHKPVFDSLAQMPNVKTIQDYNLTGMSELEVLLSDMALGATCDIFVPDAFSSLTSVIRSMRGGVGLMSPQRVAVEGGERGNARTRQRKQRK